MNNSYWPLKYTTISEGIAHCSLTAEAIDARLVYYDCIGDEGEVNVYELAQKYYPRMWDKSRIEALVAAGRLSEKEAKEILEKQI